MSGISSITPAAHPLPPATSGNGGKTSSTLVTDQKAATDADAAAAKAAAQLAADQKAKAAQTALNTDQQAVKATATVAQTAAAKVQADENQSGGLNMSV